MSGTAARASEPARSAPHGFGSTDVSVHPAWRRPLRIAVVAAIRPRKLGSFEDWLCAIVAEGRRRGHEIDLVTHEEVHPVLVERFAAMNVRWHSLDALVRTPGHTTRWLARDIDVVLFNLVQPRDPIAVLAYLAWPARVLFVDGSSRTAVTPRRIGRLLDRVVSRRIAGIAGVSDFVSNHDARRFGLRAPQLLTIYNGVDEVRFAPQPERPPDGLFRILAVSQLIPEKGIDVLLRALAEAELPNAYLTLVGDGVERDRLATLASELGLTERLDIAGKRSDVEHLLAQSDVFVQPCVWQEAFGLVVIEAMAAQRPVIASNVGGIPEIITHGVNGLLVPPGSPSALAAMLRRVCQRRSEAARLATEGRATVLARFRLAETVARTLDWCEASAREPAARA